MKKILVIEDDKTIKTELKKLLNGAGYNCITLENFKNTLIEIKKLKPDLILLDINIPFENGENILRELRKESSIPVIMVTSRISEIDEVLSISYGADDYITKPYNPTILLLRIQNIFKRMTNTSYDMNYDGIQVDPSKGILCKNNKSLELTKNEMIIFIYLLNNRGKIVSRDDLMTNLWNNNEYINDNALTVNISRLRAKLEEFELFDVIETKKGQGYKLK